MRERDATRPSSRRDLSLHVGFTFQTRACHPERSRRATRSTSLERKPNPVRTHRRAGEDGGGKERTGSIAGRTGKRSHFPMVKHDSEELILHS